MHVSSPDIVPQVTETLHIGFYFLFFSLLCVNALNSLYCSLSSLIFHSLVPYLLLSQATDFLIYVSQL